MICDRRRERPHFEVKDFLMKGLGIGGLGFLTELHLLRAAQGTGRARVRFTVMPQRVSVPLCAAHSPLAAACAPQVPAADLVAPGWPGVPCARAGCLPRLPRSPEPPQPWVVRLHGPEPGAPPRRAPTSRDGFLEKWHLLSAGPLKGTPGSQHEGEAPRAWGGGYAGAPTEAAPYLQLNQRHFCRRRY